MTSTSGSARWSLAVKAAGAGGLTLATVFLTSVVSFIVIIIAYGSMGFGFYSAPDQESSPRLGLAVIGLVVIISLILVASVSTLTTRAIGVSWQTSIAAAAYSQAPLLIVYIGLLLSSELRELRLMAWLPTILIFVVSPILNIIVATAIEGTITRKLLVIELALAGSLIAAPVMWIAAPAAAGLVHPSKRR